MVRPVAAAVMRMTRFLRPGMLCEKLMVMLSVVRV